MAKLSIGTLKRALVLLALSPSGSGVAVAEPVPVVVPPDAPAQVAPPTAGVRAAIVYKSVLSSYRGERMRVDIVADGAAAAVHILWEGAALPLILPLRDPYDALLLLADNRYSFVRPVLLQWAGTDLGLLRARTLAAARARYEQADPDTSRTTAESLTGKKVRAILQYASVLADNGSLDEALQLLRQRRDTLKLMTASGMQDWALMTGLLANYTYLRDGPEAALAVYGVVPKSIRSSPYLVDFNAGHAALLAIAGHYDEALQTIDRAIAESAALRADYGQSTLINGSSRYFASVKACALKGLGRTAEAAQTFAPVVDGPEPKAMTEPILIQSNWQVRQGTYYCMNDLESLVREMVTVLDQRPLVTDALLVLQPGWHEPYRAELMARLRSDPRVVRAAGDRLRILPPELIPALNHWQNAAASSR